MFRLVLGVAVIIFLSWLMIGFRGLGIVFLALIFIGWLLQGVVPDEY